jgi:hypothetical protein
MLEKLQQNNSEHNRNNHKNKNTHVTTKNEKSKLDGQF